MSALDADRGTKIKTRLRQVSYKVATETTIYAGAMVALNTGGFLVPAADTADLVVVGKADEQVVNAGANGLFSCKVSKGVHHWVNNGTNPVVQATVGKVCYVVDDQTVRATGSTNDVIAGIVDEIDPDGGVWVATMDLTPAAA